MELIKEFQPAVHQFNIDLHKYAVVSHSAGLDGYLYVTAQPVHEMFDTNFIKNHKIWKDAVERGMGLVRFEIHALFTTRAEAINHAAIVRRELRPKINHAHRTAKSVKRLDTGETWRSATDAANAHGISRGAMSNHLNRRKNYETIHGLVFEWVKIVLYQPAAPAPMPQFMDPNANEMGMI